MVVPILSPTWTGMLVYAVLSGAFIGTYFAVDLAVMSLVLPDKENEGRDFGILAVATGLPQILSSVIAGVLITFLGGTSRSTFRRRLRLVAGARHHADPLGQLTLAIERQHMPTQHPAGVRLCSTTPSATRRHHRSALIQGLGAQMRVRPAPASGR